jgi:LSD1 subclass zinc finger protein
MALAVHRLARPRGMLGVLPVDSAVSPFTQPPLPWDTSWVEDRSQVLGASGKASVNPMLAVAGVFHDPERSGALRACGDCRHFLRLSRGNKTVRKCERRSLSHSEATDHRARWTACGLFEEEEDGR